LRHPNGRQARPVALRTTSTSTVTATTTKTATPTAHPPSTASFDHARHEDVRGHTPHPADRAQQHDHQRTRDTARQQFEQGGWTVTSTGNITNDILSTCATYDPSDPANQAAALQLQQQFPAIKRVKERFSELPPGPIVVVLTTDYS